MAHKIDVSLKSLFLREGDGIIRQRLFGGKVTELLSTEQPQIFNHRADMVVRTEDGSIHHVEFQTANEAGFERRMVEYYAYLIRVHERHVTQTVLYLGRKPLRLASGFQSPSIDFRYEVITLSEIDAGPLVSSPDWADNALAMLANGSPELALEIVIQRLSGMESAERDWAAGTILLLSGILGIEESVSRRLREVGMINVMENKVLGPIIMQKYEQGRSEGRSEGRIEGRSEGRSEALQGLLRQQLTGKFGVLPEWAAHRLATATEADLHIWGTRILEEATLEATLR